MAAPRKALRRTFQWPAARRSLLVAVIVGTLLNSINQGDALINGEPVLDWKLLLTYFIPFAVASYGSYAAYGSECPFAAGTLSDLEGLLNARDVLSSSYLRANWRWIRRSAGSPAVCAAALSSRARRSKYSRSDSIGFPPPPECYQGLDGKTLIQVKELSLAGNGERCNVICVKPDVRALPATTKIRVSWIVCFTVGTRQNGGREKTFSPWALRRRTGVPA